MKKTLLLLFAFVATMCIPSQVWSAQVTFRFVYNGAAVSSFSNSPSISIYKNGESLTSGTLYSYNGNTLSLTVDDSYVGQNVLYMSSLGHQGYLTIKESGTSQDLNVKKLTVSTKDKDGNALTSQYINVYNAEGKSFSANTDYSEGKAILYLPAGNAYTYKWESDNQTGTIDLSNDYELNLVRGESSQEIIENKKYSVKFICKYGDYPVSNFSNPNFYIYRYGETSNQVTSVYMSSYSSSSSNSASVQLPTGSYWIQDPYGGYSQKIEVKEDMTVYLDYHKVTFISKTGSTPNVGQSIGFGYSYMGSSVSVSTNANGEATVYRLAGDYTYTVGGRTFDLKVGNEDKTENISMSKVTITLKCDNPSDLATQNYSWGTGTYSSYGSNYNTVTPEDGKITLAAIPGDYKLVINGISEINVKVMEGENNVSVQLYSLMFTTNLNTLTNMYVFSSQSSSNGKQIGFNNKCYLPGGDYYYSSASNYSSSLENKFTLNANKVIAVNYGTVTVTVKDTDGNLATSNVYVSMTGQSSATPDENGQVKLTVPYGTYQLYTYYDSYHYDEKTITVSGDVTETLTVPSYITFNVLKDGEPYSRSGYSLSLTSTDGRREYARFISDGVAMARIAPNQTWGISGYKGSVTISEGSTVSLGTLTVGSEGMGVAFPMDEWRGTSTSTFDVIVGSTVRLTAIPVYDDKFKCWVVNSNEIKSPVVDLKLTEANTVATAVFDGTVPGASGARAMRGDANLDGEVGMPDVMYIVNHILEGKYPDE